MQYKTRLLGQLSTDRSDTTLLIDSLDALLAVEMPKKKSVQGGG